MKISFIGGGNMGEAMLARILDKKVSTPLEIAVSDVSAERCQYLQQKYGVTALSDNRKVAEKGEVVVFAVKPQNLSPVMADLNGHLKPTQLVLSIVAGARISTLTSGLNHKRIVRSMPNTPAQIGEGITVWTATPEVTAQQKKSAGSILSAIGEEIYVDDEKYLDMATAVSGSGPAYFFLYVEALVEAAQQLGFTHEVAQKLVVQTMLGSGHLIQQSGKPPAELRRMVTSPGGTTAAALEELNKGQFNALVARAVKAAYNRAIELGGK